MCVSFGVYFLKFHLNITFADNELVEDKEGEDDGHGEGDEAKLVGVDLHIVFVVEKRQISTDRPVHPLLSQLLTIVDFLPLL